MSYYVYALYSKPYRKIYIGYSSDLENRIHAHNVMATKGWTIRYRPWELVYTEIYLTKSEAIRREKQLKSARGRKFIWEQIVGGGKGH